jgi:hypothetical protein
MLEQRLNTSEDREDSGWSFRLEQRLNTSEDRGIHAGAEAEY